MSRLALVWLVGCSTGAVQISEEENGSPQSTDDPRTGFETGPWESPAEDAPEVDEALYDGAYARILSPRAGDVLAEGVSSVFEVGLFAADGSALEGTAVEWYASDDPEFASDALRFESADLAIGTHELTAIVDLPNGDRLAHGVGGIRVQSASSGTYAGLFSVDGSVNQVVVTCVGQALIVVGASGDLGGGSGECLISLLGIDLPMNWVFSLESAGGVLTGTAGVQLPGVFNYDLPMTAGAIDPEGVGMTLAFQGPIPFIGELSAELEAQRISLDSE